MCHIPYDQNYTTQFIRIPSLAILPVTGKGAVRALPQRQPFCLGFPIIILRTKPLWVGSKADQG